jgi:hypothetical protein
MNGRVSWQRLAVLRGQLTERDWEIAMMLKRIKLANCAGRRAATTRLLESGRRDGS